MEREDDRSDDLKDKKVSSSYFGWDGERGDRFINRTKKLPARTQFVNWLSDLKPGKAIELGAGAGNETAFMLKNDWEVLAIDINPKSQDSINELINDEERKRFVFKRDAFQCLKLEKESADLIVAINSLHFCEKEECERLIKEIKNSLRKDGQFIGTFLGLKHDWYKENKEQYTFLTKEELKEILIGFEVSEESIREHEFDQEKDGQKVHWHEYWVKVKKK